MASEVIELQTRNLQLANKLEFNPLFPNEASLRLNSAVRISGVTLSKEELLMTPGLKLAEIPEAEDYLVAAIVLPGCDNGYQNALQSEDLPPLDKLIYRQITTRLVLGQVVSGPKLYIRFLSFVVSKYIVANVSLSKVIESVARSHKEFDFAQAKLWEAQIRSDLAKLIPVDYAESPVLLRGGSNSYGRLTESILLIRKAVRSEQTINLIDLLEISKYPLDLDILRIALHAYLLKDVVSENERQLVSSWLSDIALLDGYNSLDNSLSYVRPFQKGASQVNGDRFERSIPTFEGMKTVLTAYKLYYSKLPNWLEIDPKTGKYNFSDKEANKLRADLNLLVAHMTELFKLELIQIGTSLQRSVTFNSSALDIFHENGFNYEEMLQALFKFLKDNSNKIQDYETFKEKYKYLHKNIKELESIFNELRSHLLLILDYLDKPNELDRPPVVNEYAGPTRMAYLEKVSSSGGKLPRLHYSLAPIQEEG